MKKLDFKKLLTIIILGLFSIAINAQNRHEISIYGAGGFSILDYKLDLGKKDLLGIGGHFGIGYKYFFNRNLGLVTAVEMSPYNSNCIVNKLSIKYQTTDKDGEVFEFHSDITDYRENQKVVMLQIPIMLQFQVGKKHQFYVAAGGKIGFPIALSNYNGSIVRIYNEGYYEFENYTYTSQHEFLGFGYYSLLENKGNLNLKTAFFVSVDFGAKWKLSEKIFLYTGLYFDYGLNNIYKKTDKPKNFVEYNSNNPSDIIVNGIMNSQYTENGTDYKNFMSKLSPLAAGIKICLTFGIGKLEKKEEARLKDFTNRN